MYECMYVCMYVYHDAGVEERDNFQELALSFHQIGPKDWTQIMGLNNKTLYPHTPPF